MTCSLRHWPIVLAALIPLFADAQTYRCPGPSYGGLPAPGLCSSGDTNVVQGFIYTEKTDYTHTNALAHAFSQSMDGHVQAAAFAQTDYGFNYAVAQTNTYNPFAGIFPRAFASSEWEDTIQTATGNVTVTVNGHLHAFYTSPNAPGFAPFLVNGLNYVVATDGVARIQAGSVGLAAGLFNYVQDGKGQQLHLPGGPSYVVDIPWTLSVLVGDKHSFLLGVGLEVFSGFGGGVIDPDTAMPDFSGAVIDSFVAPPGTTLTSSMGHLSYMDGVYTYAAPVPEPEIAMLLIAGLAALGAGTRRRRRPFVPWGRF